MMKLWLYELFSGFLLAIAKVVSITAMISFQIISKVCVRTGSTAWESASNLIQYKVKFNKMSIYRYETVIPTVFLKSFH